MWTPDVNRCPACPKREKCADQKVIRKVLSALTNELNTNPEHVDSPGDGIIIVACQEKF